MKTTFTIAIILLIMMFSINAASQEDEYMTNFILSQVIQNNCKSLSDYTLPSGDQVDCITDKYIWIYGFAKDYKKILNKVIRLATIIDKKPHVVLICAQADECNHSANEINSFTFNNNIESIQMSAVINNTI